jgi:pseudaminic acid synthase
MGSIRPMMARPVSIAGRVVGPGAPPFVVAEISANHNGSMRRALDLIDAAKDAGADAVKIQTYSADTLTIDFDGPGFRIKGGLWDGRTLYDLYREASTPWDWHRPMFDHAARRGITLFSTPFDETAIDLLQQLDAPAYKIASFEASDLPLVERAAKTGKPVIISTGMCRPDEIEETVSTVRNAGNDSIVLLHCVSAYPARASDTNLRTIPHLAQRHHALTGLSDHTMGDAVAVGAVALGACIIEKHFTLRRADGGPDATFSLEPEEFAALVRNCRVAWDSLGDVREGRQEAAEANVVFKRSLYVVADIAQGDVLTSGNVRSIRPGYGIAPKHLPQVLGRRAKYAVARGTPLAWDMVETSGA